MRPVFVVLILLHAFTIVAMASELNNVAPSSNSMSNIKLQNSAEAPLIRKLGKHSPKLVKSFANAPHLSPTESPHIKDNHLHSKQEISRSHEIVLNDEIYMKKPVHHGGSDNKSVAGGGVILGGLATTFFVAIFCYIRATRRNSATPLPDSS